MAGYARSGSTFLDSVLGAHPDVFSAGELTHLFDDAVTGAACGCGTAVRACEVWGPLLDGLAMGPERARTVTRAAEHGLATGGRRAAAVADYDALWRDVLAGLDEQVDARVLVDASKTLQFAARRPGHLSRLVPDRLRVVHLTRDPRASAWSVRKGGNPIARDRRAKVLDPWRTAITWTAANLVAERTATGAPSVRLRYEDLVDEPRTALGPVGALLGLDLSDVADRLVDGRVVPVGHGIAGNRMRRSGPIRLRPDTDWVDAAPTTVRIAGRLTWPIARRYGYTSTRSTVHGSQRPER